MLYNRQPWEPRAGSGRPRGADCRLAFKKAGRGVQVPAKATTALEGGEAHFRVTDLGLNHASGTYYMGGFGQVTSLNICFPTDFLTNCHFAGLLFQVSCKHLWLLHAAFFHRMPTWWQARNTTGQNPCYRVSLPPEKPAEPRLDYFISPWGRGGGVWLIWIRSAW